MEHKQRVLNALSYTSFDRFPTKHYGTPEINKALMDYFDISTHKELLEKVGDDFRFITPRYIGPERRKYEDGSWEGLWGERYKFISFGKGTYPEAVYLPFKDLSSTAELKKYQFPSPDWFDYSLIREECEKNKEYALCIGGAGVPDFINGIARCRGVEQVLIDIAMKDPVYIALMEQRFEFYYEMIRRTLSVAEGMIDIVCFGEDLGTQNGLMISPAVYDELFAPKMKALFDLAHQYGARSMMHSCGSCRDLIPRLIELGLDILEVVQVDACKMDIQELHRDFYGKIAFCGSISVQNTLPYGSVEDVRREVELRKQLFRNGGMIIAATHDIQVGTPIENIVAMYDAIGSLKG
jgi:uroporphyrinogen decarboxylase